MDILMYYCPKNKMVLVDIIKQPNCTLKLFFLRCIFKNLKTVCTSKLSLQLWHLIKKSLPKKIFMIIIRRSFCSIAFDSKSLKIFNFKALKGKLRFFGRCDSCSC